MIEWEKYARLQRQMTPTEKALIHKMFDEYVKGNDVFGNDDASERSRFYEGFVAGWLCVLTWIPQDVSNI